MTYSIDRIENSRAIAIDEDGGLLLVPVNSFPSPPFEGLVFRLEGDEVQPDLRLTEERRRIMAERMAKLMARRDDGL